VSLPLRGASEGAGDDLMGVGEVVAEDVEGEDVVGDFFDDLSVTSVVIGVL